MDKGEGEREAQEKKEKVQYYFCEAPGITVPLAANSSYNELSKSGDITKTDTFIKTSFTAT